MAPGDLFHLFFFASVCLTARVFGNRRNTFLAIAAFAGDR